MHVDNGRDDKKTLSFEIATNMQLAAVFYKIWILPTLVKIYLWNPMLVEAACGGGMNDNKTAVPVMEQSSEEASGENLSCPRGYDQDGDTGMCYKFFYM